MEILKAVSTWRVLDTIVWTVFKGELCLYVAYKLLLWSLDPLSMGEIWAIGVAYGCRCRPTLLRFLRGVFSYPDTPLRLSRRDAVQPWAMLLSSGYRIVLGTRVFFPVAEITCCFSQHRSKWPKALGVLFTPPVQYSVPKSPLPFCARTGTTGVALTDLKLCWGSKGKPPSPVHLWANTPALSLLLALVLVWQATSLVLFFQVLIQVKRWRI